MSMNEKEFLWVEKIRPQTLSDCVLPDHVRTTFQNFIDQGEIQHLLLSSSQGMGKTSVAKSICNDLNADYIMINGSEDTSIDTIRGRLRDFASTSSMMGTSGCHHKIVIYDEAEYLSPNAQAGLRSFLEEFSSNCRFILTCNFKNRIIEPLHSRCVNIEFSVSEFKQPKIMAHMHKRICSLVEHETSKKLSKTEKGIIGELVARWAPDFRRTINELQKYVNRNSQIDSGILSEDILAGGLNKSISLAVQPLVEALKGKNFKEVRQWVVENQDIADTAQIYRKLYDQMYDFLQPQSIPQLVLLLAEYQYKDSFVADHEINTTALMVEIMMKCQFK